MSFTSSPGFHHPIASNDTHAQQGLGDFIGCFSRRRKIIFIFIMAALIFGSLFAAFKPRLYQANATLLVQLAENQTAQKGGYSLAQGSQESVILSTAEMLQSSDIAEDVIRQLNLAVSPKAFQNRLSAKPVGRSLLIDVNYQDTNAAQSAEVVNRVVASYQQKQADDQGRDAENRSAWLSERLDTLSQKVNQSAEAVEAYRSQADPFGNEDYNITSEQISDVSAQLVVAKAEQAKADAEQTQLKNILENKKSPDNIDVILNASSVDTLKYDENKLQSHVAELQSKYGANHPHMKAAYAELGQIRAKKEQEIRRVSSSLDKKAETARTKAETLQASLDGLLAKHHVENKASIGLHELERQAESDRIVYQDFLKRYKDTAVATDLNRPGIKII